MIIIEAIVVNGQTPPQPLAAEFDELGGNIGRADGNTLVLPDPDKIISRTHAAIAFRGGRYVISDRGSVTPVYVNGRALGGGRESAIDVGDEIRIGGYTLVVKAGTAGAMPPGARPAAASSPPNAGPARPGGSKDDPLQLLGKSGGGGSGGGLFDDLIPPAERAVPAPPPTPAPVRTQPADDPFAARPPAGAPVGSGMAIPVDFDPFELAAPAPAPAPHVPGRPLIPDDFDPGSPGASIDKLFDLGPSVRADPFAPGHPLSPFEAGSPAGAARATQRDDAPEVRGAFRLPQARPDSAPEPPAPRARALVPPSAESKDMIVSWEQAAGASGEIQTVIFPAGPAPQADPIPPADPVRRAPRESKASGPEPAAAAPATTTTAPPATAAAVPSDDELLHAFLAGAGVPELGVTGLSPQLMHIFGQLLREATQGTLDLLAARAIAKKEMRADMTMISARENNPLKFSPNAEAALSHLLAPQGRGFMTPIRAMRDAYDDLRAHQFAFMAGMRDALTGVLARFDPVALERRLTQKSVIDSVLPMNRKAKLWDLFEQLYADIQREAEDDFHTLFGREFVRAYEAQLAKLERGHKDRND